MKYDLISQVEDYLNTNTTTCGAMIDEYGNKINIFQVLKEPKSELEEVFKEVLPDYVGSSERKLPYCIEKVLKELNDCSYPEMNALRVYASLNNDHRGSYFSGEATNYLMFSSNNEANRVITAKMVIKKDTILIYSNEGEFSLTFSKGDTKEFKLTRLKFRNDDDLIVCEIDDTAEKTGKIYIYSNCTSFFNHDTEIPENAIPDITCNFTYADFKRAFIVTDDDNNAIGDGERLFVGEEPITKNMAFIRKNDSKSDLKLYRALCERVDEKYHENCLFDKKSKVITRRMEPIGPVKLDG